MKEHIAEIPYDALVGHILGGLAGIREWLVKHPMNGNDRFDPDKYLRYRVNQLKKSLPPESEFDPFFMATDEILLRHDMFSKIYGCLISNQNTHNVETRFDLQHAANLLRDDGAINFEAYRYKTLIKNETSRYENILRPLKVAYDAYYELVADIRNIRGKMVRALAAADQPLADNSHVTELYETLTRCVADRKSPEQVRRVIDGLIGRLSDPSFGNLEHYDPTKTLLARDHCIAVLIPEMEKGLLTVEQELPSIPVALKARMNRLLPPSPVTHNRRNGDVTAGDILTIIDNSGGKIKTLDSWRNRIASPSTGGHEKE